MFQKPRLQGQLESIEQAANAYLEKEAAIGKDRHSNFENFDFPEPADKERCSELQRRITKVVGEVLVATADSSFFDESDRQALRDGLRRADAALRFRNYRRWNSFVEHDEGTVLCVVPAGQAEDPIFSVPHAREPFKEGLDAIGRILIRVPDQAQGEIEEASSQQQARKTKVSVFPSDPGLRWEEVNMAFVSDEAIKVRARGQLREYRFDQIGFKDERTDDRPNRLWFFLQAFAGNHGQVSWEDLGRFGMTANQVQSNVKRLRKSLCEFMDIEDDPFQPYRGVNAYQARFTITGDAGALVDSVDDDSESDLDAVYQSDLSRLR